MPLFKIQVKKHLFAETRQWSNDWYVNTADRDSAESMWEEAILDFEKAVHYDDVTIDEAVISTFPVSDGDFLALPVNQTGDRDGGASGGYYPLFNTFLFKFTAAGVGRFSVKYIRGPVGEGDVTNFVINDASLTTLSTALTALFTAITELDAGTLAKSDGTNITSGVVQSTVQMRQQHRKRKKAVAP
jgi:hypothetical protein